MIASLAVLTASIVQIAAAAPSPQVKAVEASPQPDVALRKIAEGDQKWKDKSYREASVAYQDAVNAEPNNVEALFKLGTSYAMLGFYRQAIDRWNRVLHLSTDPAVKKSAEENIAKAQAKIAKSGEGGAQGPAAPSKQSPARGAYTEGVKEINAGRYEAALEYLSQAIRADPKLALAYVARGSAYIGLRRFSEAASDYQQAQKLDPALSAPLYGLAEAFRGLGRLADARQYYERYAQSKGTDVRPELQTKAREQAAALR
jgi:tetratricopeptide (TPR) repeat protein